MLISLSADELTGVARELPAELGARGHETLLHGALAQGERDGWAWASEAVARDVAVGRAEQGVVCCWTGTGASIAANKVDGVRAALCLDASSAAGARRWNDANVLAISLRSTSQALLGEILDAWMATQPSVEEQDLANIGHLREISGERVEIAPQLAVRGGRAAVEFYKAAFGAVELHRAGGSDPPFGRAPMRAQASENEAVVAQLAVDGASFWVADESPEHGSFSPESLEGASTKMLLRVPDPQAALARALAAGAREIHPVQAAHGWLIGKIEDPYGHHWEIAAPTVPWPPPGGDPG